ncbi:hypothetical protein K9M79_02840 [Candidatus Woesearchaeota archaeon]|nr:hypothetical protein [Candidatus Woesearchaeota archaeon]
MKYKQSQIYFWRSSEDLFGKAITYYNNKTFPNQEWLPTHVGIISQVDNTTKKVLIHEAGPNGFLSSWYDFEWLENKIKEGYVKIGETKEPLNDNVFPACEKYKGIRYGWLDIIGIALNYLIGWKLLGITGKNAIICSEAVSRIIYDCSKKTNIADEYGIVYDAVTPAHIYLSKYLNYRRKL